MSGVRIPAPLLATGRDNSRRSASKPRVRRGLFVARSTACDSAGEPTRDGSRPEKLFGGTSRSTNFSLGHSEALPGSRAPSRVTPSVPVARSSAPCGRSSIGGNAGSRSRAAAMVNHAKMRVAVEGQANRRVPGQCLRLLGMHAGFRQPTNERVPQRVEFCHAAKTGLAAVFGQGQSPSPVRLRRLVARRCSSKLPGEMAAPNSANSLPGWPTLSSSHARIRTCVVFQQMPNEFGRRAELPRPPVCSRSPA